jgi:hypothetical protein
MVAGMSYPKHFDSAAHFAKYLLECAERDREAFLDAMVSGGYPLSEDDQTAVDQTKAELREIRKRQHKKRRPKPGRKTP